MLTGNIDNKKIKQWERLGNACAAGVRVWGASGLLF